MVQREIQSSEGGKRPGESCRTRVAVRRRADVSTQRPACLPAPAHPTFPPPLHLPRYHHVVRSSAGRIVCIAGPNHLGHGLSFDQVRLEEGGQGQGRMPFESGAD